MNFYFLTTFLLEIVLILYQEFKCWTFEFVRVNHRRWVGGGGFWTSHLLYLILQIPAPFYSDSHTFVPFLSQNIMQCCKMFLSFSQFPPSWESTLPPSLVLSPIPVLSPVLLDSCPPVPLHTENTKHEMPFCVLKLLWILGLTGMKETSLYKR